MLWKDFFPWSWSTKKKILSPFFCHVYYVCVGGFGKVEFTYFIFPWELKRINKNITKRYILNAIVWQQNCINGGINIPINLIIPTANVCWICIYHLNMEMSTRENNPFNQLTRLCWSIQIIKQKIHLDPYTGPSRYTT